MPKPNPPPKKPGSRLTLWAAIFLLLSAGVYFYMEQNSFAIAIQNDQPQEERLQFVNTNASIPYDFDSHASFYSYNSPNFYFCTKDGISYMGLDGRAIWTHAFTMTAPEMVGEQGYVAVAEAKGKSIYVFSPTGLLYSKVYEYPILSYSLNGKGFLTVTLSKEDNYQQLVYTDTGYECWVRAHNDINEFPICSDISNDGKIVSDAVLNINGVDLVTNLFFAYLSQTDSTQSPDTIFGGRKKESLLVGAIGFLEDNKLVVVSDQDLSCYELREENLVTDIFELPLTNRIDHLKFMGNKYIVVAEGEQLLNQQAESEYMLKIYSASGLLTGSFTVGKKITYVSTDLDKIIVGVGHTYYALNFRGQVLWEYNATQDLNQLIFVGNQDTVLLAAGTKATVMKMQKSTKSFTESVETAPDTSVSEESVSEEPVSEESVPEQAVPEESVPEQTEEDENDWE